MKTATSNVRIIPKNIPNIEKKLLCATFLEAVLKFYKNDDNMKAFTNWCTEKGEDAFGSKNS